MAIPDTYRRQAIVEALVARLEAIRSDDEFETDAGQAVFVGETPQLGPDDPNEAIAISIGDDEVRYQGENVFLVLPVTIEALVKGDLDRPYLTAERVLGDIKRAIELSDRTLGGLVRRQIERSVTRTLRREPGMTAVGIGVTYLCPYVEAWGAP